MAVLAATVAQFFFGALWYMPIFGKIWGKIHGFDTKSTDVQEEMRKGMAPLLIAQFVFTFVTTWVFALLLNGFPESWNIYGLAGFFWLGFVLPTQVAAVLFGGTKPGWVLTKIAIMGGASFICLQIAALVLKSF